MQRYTRVIFINADSIALVENYLQPWLVSVSFQKKPTHICLEVCEDNSNLRFRQSNCFVSYFMNELQKLLLMQKLPDQ